MNAKEIIRKLLENADIKINGSRAWDIKVRNENLYNRILAGGSLALGESYMDGWCGLQNIFGINNKNQ